MEKITGIYKITNPQGKIYIGQSININRRWYAYQNLERKSMGLKLYNSLNKYGPENHIFEIIKVCKVAELREQETYYKQLYDSVLTGLNTKPVDDRYGPHSQATKELISKKCKDAAKKRIYTEEWKANMKQKKTGHPCYKSKERSQKIGAAHKGKAVPKEVKDKIYTESWRVKNKEAHKHQMKQVAQIDKTGKVVAVWESITEAKTQTGIKGINNVLTGLAKTAGSYTWRVI